MTRITLEHVSKHFHQRTGEDVQRIAALDNVSLKITSGTVFAILGPSGCGKSTLLRIVAGLITPDQGRVLYDDVDLREIPMTERGVGMAFQEGALIPHFDVRQNIGFFLWLRKREEEVPARVARISQITGIGMEKLLNRHPRHLSGGERQRVGIARALTRDPRVFLFDEPFSNLDAKLRAQARVELKRLLQEFPVTSLYVTHDQLEAVALAQRIAVMRAGKIEQVGSYETLYYNPINLFVATFIGTPTMNLFEGEVTDHHWVCRQFGGFPIRTDLPDGSRVTLGIRSEYIHPAAEGVTGQIESVIPHYAERAQMVEIKGDGGRWVMTMPMHEHIAVGDTITCALDEEGLLFFDTRTEQRIG